MARDLTPENAMTHVPERSERTDGAWK